MSHVPAFDVSDLKQYDPWEGACAIAQFLPADPGYWLEQAGLAGMVFWVASDDQLGLCWTNCAPSQADFLKFWLNLTLGGPDAVVRLLKLRGAA